MHFLDNYDSENVLILSGDHIYKMDYSKMLAEHVLNDADCTIAVIDVPWEEASRFGVMSYDENQADYRVCRKTETAEEQSRVDGRLHFQKGRA